MKITEWRGTGFLSEVHHDSCL